MRNNSLLRWLVLILVLIPAVAAVAAVLASPTWQEHRRKCALIGQIHQRGGLVRVERAGPDWMRPLGAYYRDGDHRATPIGVYDRIVEIRLIDAKVTDDFLAELADCKDLRVLNLSQNPVTGAGLKHLARLKHLEDLDLAYTEVSDDDMGALGEIVSLRRLDLSHNRLSGRGLHRLEPLENLETVCFVATPLRDGALERLTTLPRLTTCNVFGCRHLSQKSIEAFQKARPDCRLFGVQSIRPFWEGDGATGAE
ncbi:MAG: hypothetical protein GXX96_28920 [Planctomycetaceae bacterium]|nr:hypothetical protein [Planctomycetaceae bacterium]